MRKRVWRQNHRGVARMDASKLDVFEDAANHDRAFIGSLTPAHIRNAIDIHLSCVLKKPIHEHGSFRRSLHSETHIVLKFGVGIDDLHRATAQHETGAHQNRVVQSLRYSERFGFAGGHAVGRLRNIELVQHRGEQLSILRDLNVLRRGPNNIYAVFLQTQGEIERGLAAELRDGAPAFLALIDVQHVLQREWLEEKFVARVVIGRDGFRVGVDHERLEAGLFERERSVNTAVIEFYALAYAIWAATEDHHFALVRSLADLIIAAIVGRIIVWGIGLELRGASVHETIARRQTKFLSLGSHGVFGRSGQMGDLPIGEAE